MKISRLPDGSPELFHTLQGEGPSLGAPAVFLRLSLCNLHCQWCDTPYTWNFEGTPWIHEDGVKFSKQEQILDLEPDAIAHSLSQFDCPRLVITGGEPLLQQKDLVRLLPLVSGLKFVEIETNGTQIPSTALDEFVTSYNVSPKLSNSGMEASLRLHEESLQFFSNSTKANFKFVIQNQADLDEVRELQKNYQIAPERIFLMPEGRHLEQIKKHEEQIVNHCIKESYRFSPRLHILLWGDQRGK